MCKCNEYSNYIHKDAEHVVTGDVSNFVAPKLIDIIQKGPSYKEPRSINFDSVEASILSNVTEFIKTWSCKEKVPLICFAGWLDMFKSLLTEQIGLLKRRYGDDIKRQSVFADKSVSSELLNMQKHFVICPVDKASKNVAIICKKFYLSTLISECLDDNSGYQHILTDVSELIRAQGEFMKWVYSIRCLISCHTFYFSLSFINLNCLNGL